MTSLLNQMYGVVLVLRHNRNDVWSPGHKTGLITLNTQKTINTIKFNTPSPATSPHQAVYIVHDYERSHCAIISTASSNSSLDYQARASTFFESFPFT